MILNSCRAWPVNDRAVKGRAATVDFPQGRYVTVVGHIHGPRQMYKLIAKYRQLPKMTDKQFVNVFKRILAQNRVDFDFPIFQFVRERLARAHPKLAIYLKNYYGGALGITINGSPNTLQGEVEDYDYLQNLLKSKNPPRFIGYETDEASVRRDYNDLWYVYQELLQQFQQRSKHGLNLSKRDFQNAILSGANAEMFVFLKNPSVFKNAEPVGVEDGHTLEQIKRSGADKNLAVTWRQFQLAIKKIYPDFDSNKFLSSHPKLLKFVLYSFFFKSDIDANAALTKQELNHRMNLVLSADPKKALLPYLHHWLSALLVEHENLKLRDVHSAVNLANLPGSAVDVVGLAHYRDVVRDLEQICTQESRPTNFARTFSGNLSGASK